MVIATCLACNKQHGVCHSHSRQVLVMETHNCEGRTCRGSGYPPMDSTFAAEKSKDLPLWVQHAISEIAYETSHSSGLLAVAEMERDMIEMFEKKMKLS